MHFTKWNVHSAVNSHSDRVKVRIHRILSNNVKVIELIWGCSTITIWILISCLRWKKKQQKIDKKKIPICVVCYSQANHHFPIQLIGESIFVG